MISIGADPFNIIQTRPRKKEIIFQMTLYVDK